MGHPDSAGRPRDHDLRAPDGRGRRRAEDRDGDPHDWPQGQAAADQRREIGRGEDARYSLLRAREELVQALDKLSVIQRLIEESDNVFDLNVDAEEGVA